MALTLHFKVTRKDNDKWYGRYKKAVATVREGSKVESLIVL
jgi:hypothetical protein